MMKCNERVVDIARQYLHQHFPGRVADAFDPGRGSHVFTVKHRILQAGPQAQPQIPQSELILPLEFCSDVPFEILVLELSNPSLASELRKAERIVLKTDGEQVKFSF